MELEHAKACYESVLIKNFGVPKTFKVFDATYQLQILEINQTVSDRDQKE